MSQSNEAMLKLSQMLNKTKDLGVYDIIGSTINKVLFIYYKRFGTSKYAKTISEIEVCEQVQDCLTHCIYKDDNTLTLMSNLTVEEQEILLAAIVTFLIGPVE